MARRGSRQKSEYGLQLAEKQKIRNEYGLRERQFRRYFDQGGDPAGIFTLLELRLDTLVFRSGFASTRRMARQMTSHGHITVNGRKTTVPSYSIKVGDVISVRDGSKDNGLWEEYEMRMKKHEPPSWITLDKKKREFKLNALPNIKEETQPFNFQTVIEFYSR
ncbi:MAG: 30S ribosomal protein S4 [Candidatus Spechtbacterales bacterium]|nr:30S ribosomal protein S4 [Candidatus Spechtbacterales bacterium]